MGRGGSIGGGGRSSGGGRIGGGGSFGGGRSSGGFGGSSGGFRPSGGSGRPAGYRPSGGASRPAGYRPNNTRPSGSTRPGGYYSTPHTTTYYGGGGGGFRPSGGTGCGCLSGVAVTIIILMFIVFVAMLLFVSPYSGSSVNGSEISKSTIQREKLDAKYVDTTAYYADEAGWISSPATLEAGMKVFYQKTGVQPFLYVTDDINGETDPSTATLSAYGKALYDELFTDEGHVLVIFYDGGGYWYEVGNWANTVFDEEAQDIFEDYIAAYGTEYAFGSMSLEELFSNVFSDTADRIMQVTRSPMIYVGIALVVLVIIVVLFLWWKKAKEQKNKEAAHAEAILNADIDDLAKDPNLSDLEQKYEKKPSTPKPKPSSQVETFETARENEGYQTFTDPTLQDLEDRYQ